ncbi:DUF4491 family protein [Chakrabartyella piscis]|uniref:DUF4491 family protein n=1 Tax=Chakrabartyella piscis TaxID=2918914 RepID=UPI002F42D110
MGLATFLIIGMFHPIVIKTEYYIGKKAWPVFLIVGVVFIIGSWFVTSISISTILGVLGFTCFWSIKELKEQEERVAKGWFPKNPNKE